MNWKCKGNILWLYAIIKFISFAFFVKVYLCILKYTSYQFTSLQEKEFFEKMISKLAY